MILKIESPKKLIRGLGLNSYQDITLDLKKGKVYVFSIHIAEIKLDRTIS